MTFENVGEFDVCLELLDSHLGHESALLFSGASLFSFVAFGSLRLIRLLITFRKVYSVFSTVVLLLLLLVVAVGCPAAGFG